MKVGSLFAGIGGIDLGFQQAGFDVLWANEIDKKACKTYRLNFPDTTLFECDIRNLDASLVPKVDIISAGFPCQPFSVCGKQKGFEDNRGNLFFEIMRIADVINPQIIFLENVKNLVNHDNGRTFNVIHNELVTRGYYIRYLVADACDYGIRKITPYECLALMGFPKDFKIADIPLKNAYKHIGNSVCVPIIQQIANSIKT